MFKGYFNVSRIVQARLKDVSYFHRCFQVFFGSDYETYLRVLLYDKNYLWLALCGMLSEICYWKFAIYVFFLRLATPCKEIVIFRDYSATRNFFLGVGEGSLSQ